MLEQVELSVREDAAAERRDEEHEQTGDDETTHGTPPWTGCLGQLLRGSCACLRLIGLLVAPT